jgi:hypothetical protein
MWRTPRVRAVGESSWTHAREVIADFRTQERFNEVREGGKVALGAGIGGFFACLTTLASVSGSGVHFRVWTVWSVLLVILIVVALAGGLFCWLFFRPSGKPTPTVVYDQRGATINNYADSPPGGITASTTDSMTVTTVFQPDPVKDRRRRAAGRLSAIIAEGQRLSWAPVERQETDHGLWQNKAFDFLHDALTDAMPAQLIVQLGRPEGGRPLRAGLGTRLARQLEQLINIQDHFDNYTIKESWQP